jgi:predicted RecA/RadA family phage recombinase
MASNYLQDGEILTLPAPSGGVTNGLGYLIAGCFGVALNTALVGVDVAFGTQGVYRLVKTAPEVIAVGAVCYWNVSTHKVTAVAGLGPVIGVATVAALSADVLVDVRLNGVYPGVIGSTQTVEAAITDNGGGAAADGTIGAVTAPTALTDNGGGTADATVAAQAAPVTLTDSTGDSATHNDTLEVVTTPTLSDWNGSSVFPSAAQATAISAAIGALRQNESDLAQKSIELVTLAGVAQNNLKELTTSQAANRLAIIALTDAVKELSAKQNAVIAKLVLAQILAAA